MTRVFKTIESQELRNGIAARLLAIRTHLGLSQRAFAAQIGYTQNTYQKWEDGSNFIDIVAFLKIYSRYRIDPNFILLQKYEGLRPEDAAALAVLLIPKSPENGDKA